MVLFSRWVIFCWSIVCAWRNLNMQRCLPRYIENLEPIASLAFAVPTNLSTMLPCVRPMVACGGSGPNWSGMTGFQNRFFDEIVLSTMKNGTNTSESLLWTKTILNIWRGNRLNSKLKHKNGGSYFSFNREMWWPDLCRIRESLHI